MSARFSTLQQGWKLKSVVLFLAVDVLPRHCPTDAEKIPQVAENPLVKWILLIPIVLQVWDPVTGHELPGGAVDGSQVEVGAQQHCCHHWEHTDQNQGCQQENVHTKPGFPRIAGRNSWPERLKYLLLWVCQRHSRVTGGECLCPCIICIISCMLYDLLLRTVTTIKWLKVSKI